MDRFFSPATSEFPIFFLKELIGNYSHRKYKRVRSGTQVMWELNLFPILKKIKPFLISRSLLRILPSHGHTNLLWGGLSFLQWGSSCVSPYLQSEIAVQLLVPHIWRLGSSFLSFGKDKCNEVECWEPKFILQWYLSPDSKVTSWSRIPLSTAPSGA